MGKRVVALREARGWTNEDLAREADLSSKTISRLENGHHEASPGTIRSVVNALEVDRSVIVGEPPAPLGLGVGDKGEPVAIVERLDHIEAMLADLLARVPKAEPGAESPPTPPGDLPSAPLGPRPTEGRPGQAESPEEQDRRRGAGG
jgi:transcriptional regulator with XRE-family HTH domain